MKLSTLTYFVEVATEGSFTKAAQKLYISQPTLSRRIQELEQEIGGELFIRRSHSLELTPVGEQFLTKTNDILDRVEQLTHLFDHQTDPNKRPQLIKIGYLPNFNMKKMYQLVDQFKTAHPNVKFLLKQDTPMDLVDGLASGNYDFVFNLATYFQQTDNFEKIPFQANHLQVALPIQHALSHQKKLRFSDLNKETFILLERQQSPIIVDYVINQFIKYGFNVKAATYVKNLDEGLANVALGEGLAFLYSGMDDGTLEEKYPIKIVDLENENSDQSIVAVFNTETANPMIRAFFKYAKENFYQSI
ncbi:LysR family transcriptional regulator [Enterococcus hermanniensis]|nr:LysR family transcriptional regulator [Enterococcus hermanniensis]